MITYLPLCQTQTIGGRLAHRLWCL